MTEYNGMTQSQIRAEEYDGSDHSECPGCGEMICKTPCVYCGWEEE